MILPYTDKSKAKEAHKRWRARNKAKIAEWDNRWKAANPERVKEYAAKTRDKSRTKEREKRLAKYAANPEFYREKSRLNYHANKASAADRNRRWRAENPDAVRAIKLNRRARLRAAGQPAHGSLSAADIAFIVARQKGRCASCGGKAKLEMDHILPLALGGGGDRTNFQGLCRPCNLSKHARHPIDFNRSRGLLL
jgi:5-methylcytosine-specific restriction endonuclease McrA